MFSIRTVVSRIQPFIFNFPDAGQKTLEFLVKRLCNEFKYSGIASRNRIDKIQTFPARPLLF